MSLLDSLGWGMLAGSLDLELAAARGPAIVGLILRILRRRGLARTQVERYAFQATAQLSARW